MLQSAPSVIVVAGPNGAGKSTTAPALLRDTLAVTEFVDADVIARGLSAFAPEQLAMAAGRIMRQRLRELAERRTTFGFETPLAGRALHGWLATLAAGGYEIHIVYLWLPSPDVAVQRVADRVRRGGHDVPEATIRRRYRSGLTNFLRHYRRLSTTWRVYDSSGVEPRLVAAGQGENVTTMADKSSWARLEHGAQ